MAGIYIHIPFCKKRCTYCDFYTEVAPQLIPNLIDSIVKELKIRSNYLKNEDIHTIYFGGGTPSILNKHQFEQIFDAIYSIYNISNNAEITFEANPDDLTSEFLDSISGLPFNRISIGIQSFDDGDLKRINRRHTGQDAINAVKNAQNAGFNNISIDLIYGLPEQTINAWKKQLEIAFSLKVQHISSYGLTYEKDTALWKQREMGKVKAIDDDAMIEMYQILISEMTKNGFDAYEISNFALPNFRSRHNTSYWKQEAYIGLGPSAHSYNISSRQWNVSSITKYIEAIRNETSFFESEELTTNDRYNDFIMVSLRTSDGINIELLEKEFGMEYLNFCLKNVRKFIETKKVNFELNSLTLSKEGIQISNLIIMELMRV